MALRELHADIRNFFSASKYRALHNVSWHDEPLEQVHEMSRKRSPLSLINLSSSDT